MLGLRILDVHYHTACYVCRETLKTKPVDTWWLAELNHHVGIAINGTEHGVINRTSWEASVKRIDEMLALYGFHCAHQP